MDSVTLISITMPEFQALITTAVTIAVENVLKAQPATEAQPAQAEFITRKEVGAKTHLSLNTVDKYTRDGIFKGYRVGKRILYKPGEVSAALQSMKPANIAA